MIHSFWVPEFGQKQDALPGQDTKLVITPTKVGTYPVICTELCGLGHALMRTSAIVMEPAAFAGWVKHQGEALNGPPGQAGKAVFDEQRLRELPHAEGRRGNGKGRAGPR